MPYAPVSPQAYIRVLRDRGTLAFSYRPKLPLVTPTPLPYRPAWKPISPRWRQNIADSKSFWAKSEPTPETKEEIKKENLLTGETLEVGFVRIRRILGLRDHLLKAAGDEACMPYVEGDINKMECFGEFWMGRGAKLHRGQPISCHENSLTLWRKNPTGVAVATGYALSRDGMWRQHSWCVRLTPQGGRVIETTEPRTLYYGFTLTPAETQAWISQR